MQPEFKIAVCVNHRWNEQDLIQSEFEKIHIPEGHTPTLICASSPSSNGEGNMMMSLIANNLKWTIKFVSVSQKFLKIKGPNVIQTRIVEMLQSEKPEILMTFRHYKSQTMYNFDQLASSYCFQPSSKCLLFRKYELDARGSMHFNNLYTSLNWAST